MNLHKLAFGLQCAALPVLLLLPIRLSAQDDTELKSFYVVVGAFAIPKNAEIHRERAINSRLPAKTGNLNEPRLTYVYVKRCMEFLQCVPTRDSLKSMKGYGDTWIKPVVEQISPAVAVDSTSTGHSTAIVEAYPDTPAEIGSKEVFLSLYDASNDRVVDGNVQVVDVDNARLLTSLKGNEYLTLPDPKNTTGTMLLMCEVTGYRKVQQTLSYSKPVDDYTKNFIEEIGTTFVISFPLQRYQRGDIYTLYSVYFYNDAAIFLPESKYELSELLVMMQENPNRRIRLHGHANGNRGGKLIEMGSSDDMFSLSSRNRTRHGSAKILSYKRAALVRDYLVANGISGDRIELRAWGGKRPLHGKNSQQARKNIRVEVEITTD